MSAFRERTQPGAGPPMHCLPAGGSEDFFRKGVAEEFEMEKIGEFFEEHGMTQV